MLPLSDINPTRRFPLATVVLIAINVLVFVIFELPLLGNERAFTSLLRDWAIVPSQLGFNLESLLDVVRSMFMHGGWAHLLGNMLYLWIFGDNLEDRMGILLYVGFYFACGFAAALAQVAVDPGSNVPMVGASGAIAGVLGGYLVLFPTVRVRGLILLGYFVRMVELSAVWVLGMWFVLQVFNGLGSVGMLIGGGVAFFAHIGGFIAGAVLTWLFTRLFPQPPAPERVYMVYRHTENNPWW